MFLDIARAQNVVAGAAQAANKTFGQKVADFFDYLIGQVPSWIAGFLLFVATIFVAKIAKSAVENKISEKIDEEHQEVLVLAGRVTYFGTFALGITIALKVAGIDITTIIAAIAFGIGFALQDLIMNFLSGVMILVSRQFTIGDFIKVGATVGKVMEIQTRATILKAVDGTKVIVPNAEIFRNQVVSFTTNPMRRVVVPLYISYDSDVHYAMKIALEVLKSHPKILKKPGPSVVVKEYGDSSIDLAARFWVGSRDGWYKVRSDIMAQMWTAYMDAGIIVPYNVMHVETSGDTKSEWEGARQREKKRKEEMGLSKAMEEEVKGEVEANGNGLAALPLVPAVATAAIPVSQNGGSPATNGSSGNAKAPVSDASITDQTEIDGQA